MTIEPDESAARPPDRRYETWRALSPLLDRALELDAPSREQWLTELGASLPSLEKELRALLDEDARLESGAFLSPEPHADLREPLRSLVGQQVGAWVLERSIGQGGMGTVWLARRSDGRFEGTAAVKLLNISLLGRDGEARFRREGSLLARLSHPNIARLLDAGLTAGAQPYLVLEYVDGERIDRWCDERRLDLPARLRLVRQVLDSVSHAHANLVVHRDLKPSNILVTGDGRVKLLDFGIAQLTAQESAELTSHAFTPEYASPEQIEGQTVTTASDIYSLGVLLYLLLTGQHATAGGSQSRATQMRAVVEREPRRASGAVSPPEAGAADAEPAAALRATTPARLARQLRGDLDTILFKALRKSPNERYATVAALADDIDRYLHHEPIRARPDAVGYRLRKFVRRNRVGVAAAAAVLLTLTTATVVTARQLVIAREQRDLALRATKRAEASSEFESFLLTQGGSGGKALTMEQMLVRARQVIDRRFARDPRLRSAMLIGLSGRYLELDDLEAERRTLAEAMRIAALIPDHFLTAEAECAYARSLANGGVQDSALVRIKSALTMLDRLPDPTPALRADCLAAEAEVYRWAGNADSAVLVQRRALNVLEEVGATSDTRYAGLLNDLSRHLQQTGRRREAVPVQQKTLAILDSLGLGDSQPHVVVVYNTASMLQGLGEYVSARDLLAADLRRAGADGNDASTMLKYLYGSIALTLTLDDTAEVWLRRAMRDTTLASAMVAAQIPAALATLHLRHGRFREARPLVRRSLDAYGHVPDRPSSQVGRVLLQARLRRAEGNTHGALEGLRTDLRWMGYPAAKAGPHIYHVLMLAAECALELGELADGERFAHAAHEIAAIDSLAASQSALVGESSVMLAKVLQAKGATAEARGWAERAVEPTAYGYGAEHPRTAEARALVDALR